MRSLDLHLVVVWPDDRKVRIRIEFKQPLLLEAGMAAPTDAEEERTSPVGLSPSDLESRETLVAFLRKATRFVADGEVVAVMAWRGQDVEIGDLLQIPADPEKPFPVVL